MLSRAASTWVSGGKCVVDRPPFILDIDRGSARAKFVQTTGAMMTEPRATTSTSSGPDDAEMPLYRRVVDALRHDIVDGRHAVGDRLPTEDALCRRFGVSRHTVREALRALRAEGLIESRQGAGTTVVRRAARPLYSYSVASIEELLQYASEARYEV